MKIVKWVLICLVILLVGVAAYVAGIHDGYASGYTNGVHDGYMRGHIDGYKSGQQDGYNAGYAANSNSGYSQGKSDATGALLDFFNNGGCAQYYGGGSGSYIYFRMWKTFDGDIKYTCIVDLPSYGAN